MAWSIMTLKEINGEIFKIKKNKKIYSRLRDGFIEIKRGTVDMKYNSDYVTDNKDVIEIPFDQLVTIFNLETKSIKFKLYKDDKPICKFKSNGFDPYVEVYLKFK